MLCPVGLVVEVLVNCVTLPAHTVVLVKLAVGWAYTTMSVVELLLWLPTVMVQV